MEIIEFWGIIESSIHSAKNVNVEQDTYLTSYLTELSLEEILEFEKLLRKLIIELDEFKVMAILKVIEGYVSDDSYLYFRCWIIGRGENFYSMSLSDPDELSRLIPKDVEPYFEDLLYVASRAHENKTGNHEDENNPRDVARSQGLDYDFNAPPTKGEDWEDANLPALYPKLCAKFSFSI